MSDVDVVEPDLLYMSRERAAEVLVPEHVRGVPELVVEIASKSTRKRDATIKRALYERAGVSEYWVVDPEIDVVRRCVPEQRRWVLATRRTAPRRCRHAHDSVTARFGDPSRRHLLAVTVCPPCLLSRRDLRIPGRSKKDRPYWLPVFVRSSSQMLPVISDRSKTIRSPRADQSGYRTNTRGGAGGVIARSRPLLTSSTRRLH